MKVRFAVQIFSTSVANALLFCKNTLKLKEFQSCQGTIEFLHVFNDLFDILNSKNMKQSGFKQLLNEQNKEIITNKLEKIKSYILSLKTIKGELLIKTREKTGFLGFLICIYNTIALYEELCEQLKLLKYISFSKLSQDHLELLFGCVRRQGGSNNNPTARQFKAAIKKILVHAEIRDVRTGNCIPLEHVSILHVSSSNTISNSEDVINMSTRFSQIINDISNTDIQTNKIEDQLYFLNDHNYLTDVRDISEFSLNIIEYIAGYVVKQLRQTLRCAQCINVLIDKECKMNSLIYIKNRGGLITPSEDVIKICKKCEIIIRHALHANKNMLGKG